MADISIKNLRKSFGGDDVLKGIDLDISDREFIVVLGPSGCGKSTLLRMIAGLEPITGGDLAIAGRSVKGLEPRERGCAMVFQNYALYPHMSVAENIGYGLRVAGVKRAERMKRVAEVAALVELSELLERKPTQLSGGQRQRAAMARAIIREPKVFLFDEPLSNLDAKLRVQMRHEVRRIHNRIGATSIFVTHDQVEGMTLADRLVVMNRGAIEQIGTPAEIYERPASTYVGGFIGSPPMNFLHCQVAECGSYATVNGTDFCLPVEPAQGRQVAGSVAVAGFRPEAAKLVGGPEETGLTFEVTFTEELGNGRLVYGDVGEREIVIQTSAHVLPNAGEFCPLTIEPGMVHLFSAESGERIPWNPGVGENDVVRSISPDRSLAL